MLCVIYYVTKTYACVIKSTKIYENVLNEIVADIFLLDTALNMVVLKHENNNEVPDDHNDCKSSIKDLIRAFERLGFERDVILNQPGELLKQVESVRRAKELWKKTKDVVGKKNIETLKKAIDKKKTGTFKIDEEKVSPDNSSEFDEIKLKLDRMIGEKGVKTIELNDDPVKQRQVYLIKKTYLDEIRNINKELTKRLEHYKENVSKRLFFIFF